MKPYFRYFVFVRCDRGLYVGTVDERVYVSALIENKRIRSVFQFLEVIVRHIPFRVYGPDDGIIAVALSRTVRMPYELQGVLFEPVMQRVGRVFVLPC